VKVLRIIHSMNPKSGGPCQGIRNSIPAQVALGVQSEVVCFDVPDADFLKKESFKIHGIGPTIGPYSYCPRLNQWLRANLLRFDVVIIHGLWQYNSYGAFRVWKWFKKQKIKVPKLYVMPHGMLDPYFQRAPSRKLKAVRNWLFWKLVERKVINGADGLLFTCEQELLLARETFWPYHPKVELNIGYGIQLPPIFEKRYQQEFISKCPEIFNRPYWLFLSRIHQKKGVDLLLSAYLKLKEKYADIPDLVIAGPGLNTSYGQSLQIMGKSKSIHFPGMLEGAAKWGAFYGCKAFMLPSHQENFGIAVVEAMACAKPVLISNQVNIWREVEKGEGGVIFEDNETGVYTMLENIIKQTKEDQISMGENAAKVFQSNYTIEKAALKMVESIR